TCPEGAPGWVKNAYREISREFIGAAYEEVVEAWIELEKLYGFVVGNNTLKGGERPKEVTQWVRDGRGRTMPMIPITDLGKFENGWWKWWTALQPSWRGSWRGRTESARGKPADASWEKLAVPGQNGLLSVVATLYWWGYAEKKAGMDARSTGWEDAMKEVVAV
ncbi:hypothetical protein B0H13DRAFT_1474817, partial [Mycena leptocephala]